MLEGNEYEPVLVAALGQIPGDNLQALTEYSAQQVLKSASHLAEHLQHLFDHFADDDCEVVRDCKWIAGLGSLTLQVIHLEFHDVGVLEERGRITSLLVTDAHGRTRGGF